MPSLPADECARRPLRDPVGLHVPREFSSPNAFPGCVAVRIRSATASSWPGVRGTCLLFGGTGDGTGDGALKQLRTTERWATGATRHGAQPCATYGSWSQLKACCRSDRHFGWKKARTSVLASDSWLGSSARPPGVITVSLWMTAYPVISARASDKSLYWNSKPAFSAASGITRCEPSKTSANSPIPSLSANAGAGKIAGR